MTIFKKETRLLSKDRIFGCDLLFFIFVFILSLLAYRVIISSPGTLARIDLDTVTPYNFPNWANHWISEGVYTWWQVDCGYRFANPGFLPVIIFGKVTSFILNADQFRLLLFVLFTALSGWLSYLMVINLAFAKVRPLNVGHRVASLVAAVAYMFNPWVFDYELFAINYVFAYAVAPLAFLCVVRAIDSASSKLNIRNAISAALTFSVVAILSLPVSYMLFLAIILYFIFRLVLNVRKFKTIVLGMVKTGAIFLISVLALNAYWIIQQFSPTGWASVTGALSVDDIATNSVACYLYNVFRLEGSPYGYFIEVMKSFANPVTNLISFVFPILCFSALIIKPKDEKVLFFSILAAVSIALGAGILGPLGNGYVWLFLHVPYFNGFRVSYKFVFLTSLAYAFLIAVVAEYLINARSGKVPNLYQASAHVHAECSRNDNAGSVNITYQAITRTHAHQAIKYVILIFLLLSLSLTVAPMLTGNMSGYLPTFNLPSEYNTVYNMLAAQPGFFRVLLLPMSTPIHPGWLPATIPYIHNPFDVNPPNHPVICYDLATPTVATLTKFLQSTIVDNDTNDFNSLLSLLSVEYIVVTKDNLIGEQLPAPNATLWEYILDGWPGYYLPSEQIMNFLTNDTELVIKYSGAYISVFEYANQLSPHIYSASTSSLIVGGGYNALTEVSESTIGLYATQYDENFLLNNYNLFDNVLFYNANITDLALSTLDNQYVFQPYDYAYHGYSFNQYWCQSDFFPVTYEPFTQGEPVDGEFAFALASNVNMSIPFSIKSNNIYEIWASVLFDSNGGNLTFTLGNKSVTVDTVSSISGLKWVPIFDPTDLPSKEYKLEISSVEGDNVINSIAIVPSTVLNELQNQYAIILQGKKVTSIQTGQKTVVQVSDGQPQQNYSSEDAALTYEQINPTEYTVQVNTSKPFFLVFSESFDTGWIASINGQQIPSQYHLMIDGFANGWYINRTGSFSITLEFSPQTLFYAGVAISTVAFIICVVFVVFASKGKLLTRYKKSTKSKLKSENV